MKRNKVVGLDNILVEAWMSLRKGVNIMWDLKNKAKNQETILEN